MNIIVLVKQVPSETNVKTDKITGNLIRSGINSMINPYDLNAIEESLNLKKINGGKITALTMGPTESIDSLSEAIGMGVDNGILLSDKAFSGADTWATSFTLGNAIKKIKEFDLILCGRQAIDGDTAQVGPELAEFLNIPHITCVFKIESNTKNQIYVKKETEKGYDSVQCNLPALLSVTNKINSPRYPKIPDIISVCMKNSNIKIWNAADIKVKTSEVGISGSLTQVIKTFTPKFEKQNKILEGTNSEIIEQLIEKLKKNNLL